jgi:hypothetical protein
VRAGAYARPVLAALAVGGACALAWAVWDATRAEAGLVDPPDVSTVLDPADPARPDDSAGDELDGVVATVTELPGGLVSSVLEPLPTMLALPSTPLLPTAEVPAVTRAEPAATSGRSLMENPVAADAAHAAPVAATPIAPASGAPRLARGSGPDVPAPESPEPRPAEERSPVAPNPPPAPAAMPSSSSAPIGLGALAVLLGAPVIPVAARWRRTAHARAPPRGVWAFSIDHPG